MILWNNTENRPCTFANNRAEILQKKFWTEQFDSASEPLWAKQTKVKFLFGI